MANDHCILSLFCDHRLAKCVCYGSELLCNEKDFITVRNKLRIKYDYLAIICF